MFLQTISKNVWIYTVRENHDDGSWLNNLKICDRSNLFVFGAACLVLFTSTVTQRDSTWYSLNMFQQESALAVQGSRGALPSQGPSSLRVWAFQIKTTSRWLMRLALQTTGGSQLSLKMQGPSGFCSSIWSGSLSNGGELFTFFHFAVADNHFVWFFYSSTIPGWFEIWIPSWGPAPPLPPLPPELDAHMLAWSARRSFS